jgi:hypothetical protein
MRRATLAVVVLVGIIGWLGGSALSQQRPQPQVGLYQFLSLENREIVNSPIGAQIVRCNTATGQLDVLIFQPGPKGRMMETGPAYWSPVPMK